MDDSFYGNWTTASTAITYHGLLRHACRKGCRFDYFFNFRLPAPRRSAYRVPSVRFAPQGSDGVVKLDLQANPYNSIFVGTDSSLAGANSIYATVFPTGGTVSPVPLLVVI